MKKMLYGIIAASAVFLTACGAKNTSKQEESKSSKPEQTALTIYDKAKDAEKSVKNSTYKMTIDLTNSDSTSTVTFDGEQSTKPEKRLRGKLSIESEGEKSDAFGLYIDDDDIYMEKDGEWGDVGSAAVSQVEEFRTLRKNPDIGIFSRDTIKKAKLKKEDGEDIIDLKADKSDLKEIREDVFQLVAMPGADFTKKSVSSEVKITKARYKMTYDSKTHRLKKADMTFTLDNGEKKVKDHIVIEYGDYNDTKVLKPTSVLKP